MSTPLTIEFCIEKIKNAKNIIDYIYWTDQFHSVQKFNTILILREKLKKVEDQIRQARKSEAGFTVSDRLMFDYRDRIIQTLKDLNV